MCSAGASYQPASQPVNERMEERRERGENGQREITKTDGLPTHPISASNGIVIATEKKQSSVLVDDSTSEKVALISKSIGMVYSGMGPDFRVLLDKARKSAQEYKKVYMEEPPTMILVQEVAQVMQEFTQSG